MKAFLETYGVAIFTIIILGIMVLMANGVGLTVEDLLKGEIKRFVTTAGEESWNSTNSKEELKVNEYGFYFDQPYITFEDEYEKGFCIFTSNGEIIWYYEITQKEFNEYKEDWCNHFSLDPDTTTLEDINQKLKENPGDVYTNVVYDKLYAEDEEGPYYFSADGTKFYWDEDLTEFGGELYVPREPYNPKYNGQISIEGPILLSGPEFNEKLDVLMNYDSIPKSIIFTHNSAPDYADIDVSLAQDSSAMAWVEGDTFYVAPKIAGQTLYANPNSSEMFKVGFETGDGSYPSIWINNADFSNLNTSKVINMEQMFYSFGAPVNSDFSTESCNILGLEDWDVSNVTNMNSMFYGAFFFNKEVNLDLSNWDVSNVTDMDNMFFEFADLGTNSCTLDLSNWNTEKVANMRYMFGFACYQGCKTFNLNVTNWNISDSVNMFRMFYYTASLSETFNIEGLSTWDTSGVTDMYGMFYIAGRDANYSLDLSSWNVSSVENFEEFNYGVESKIISPWD